MRLTVMHDPPKESIMPIPVDVELVKIDFTDDEQLGRWLAVRNQVEQRPVTVAGYRAELSSVMEHIELLAVRDGVDVGGGGGGWGAILAEFSEMFIEVWVLPGHRRQGIGTALADRLVAFAIEHGMVNGRSGVIDGDEASVRFVERYGLTEYSRGQIGGLELTAEHAAAVPALPEGVTLTSLAERPDLARALYDLDVLVQPEIPSLASSPIPSFEAWRAQAVDDPGFVTDLSVIALRGDRVVGTIQLYDDADGTAVIGMAAVDPGARRQGIARALKVEMARRAATTGWRRIDTFNDGSNDRMRALNIELGYVYLPRRIGFKGPLRVPAATDAAPAGPG
jgi:GNAT superfamily N-acetyltransferase